MSSIHIIITFACLYFVFHTLYWSKMARSTNELGRLNRIWEAYNDQKITKEEALIKVRTQKWNHHQDKVDLFVLFLNLIK